MRTSTFASGDALANLVDRARENCGAAVGLIVAIHGRDHGVAQAHSLDGFGYALGLVFVRRAQRLAGWARRRIRTRACRYCRES